MALVVSATAPGRAVARIRTVAPGDPQLAFAQATAADGIVLEANRSTGCASRARGGSQRDYRSAAANLAA